MTQIGHAVDLNVLTGNLVMIVQKAIHPQYTQLWLANVTNQEQREP